MTNVALVVLDTLRKDAFDRHFDWLPGRRYARAFATANWTVPAHASLFTGRYASEVGVHAKHMQFDADDPALAERLREAGYTTRAFSANTNVTGHFGFDRGFAEFHTPDRMRHLTDDDLFDWRAFDNSTDVSGVRKYIRAVRECVSANVDTIPSLVTGAKLLRDDTGVECGGAREAISYVEDATFGDAEFFFCNLMETHEPYRAPEAYQTVEEPPLTEAVGDVTDDPVDGEQTRQAYDDCARYLSDVYRELFELLREDFDYVITLSDHGELLGEHGAWGHEHGVYPELAHVPLVISGDGLEGTCERTVSLLDVHRTVLDLAGLAGGGRGQSLRAPVDEVSRLAEYHGLTGWSADNLASWTDEDTVEVYDRELRGVAFGETYYGYETLEGFVETGEAPIDAPRDRFDELVEELDVRDVETDQAVPEAVQDRLEDLGYA